MIWFQLKKWLGNNLHFSGTAVITRLTGFFVLCVSASCAKHCYCSTGAVELSYLIEPVISAAFTTSPTLETAPDVNLLLFITAKAIRSNEIAVIKVFILLSSHQVKI